MSNGRDTIARGAAAAVMLISAALAVGGPAMSAPPAQAGLDEVLGALGVDRVPSDYVVMVDVSGSMGGSRYAQVKNSLTGFFAALAPEDRVTVIPFAERATAKTQPVGRAPAQLVQALPRNADGDYTDIGAALERSVEVLGRSDAPAIATVVLLTDGRHDPGPGSAYPLTQGHNWNQLAAAARRLRKTSLDAYAIPLSGATGAPLLAKVFPGARILPAVSVDRLTTTLARPKAVARTAKARSLVAGEIDDPLSVDWPAGPIGAGRSVLDVRVHSSMPHVPLVLDGLTVRSGNAGVTCTVGAGPVVLPPGGTVTVPVTVEWDAGPRSIAPRKTVRDRVDLQLSAQVGSPWSTVLSRDLGLPFRPAPATPPAGRDLYAQRGSFSYWIVTVALLAVLVVLLLRWRRARLRPRLTGALLIGAGSTGPRTLPLTGHRLQLSAGTTGLPGSGEVTAARDKVGSGDVQLLISYSPDGSAGRRDTGACRSGRTVSVAGTSFTWQNVPAQRGSTAR